MTSSRSLLLLLVAALMAATALTRARAAPLDAETCTRLLVEHGALENAGVEKGLTKGPEWAKANLAPDKIEQIRRYIELEELILFRCRSKSRVALPPDPEESEKDQDKAKDKDNDADKAKDQVQQVPGKQETVISKTLPSAAKAKEPALQAAKRPPGDQGKPGEPRGQSKAAPRKQQDKQAASGAKAQAKTKVPAKTGATAGDKAPKAKVDGEASSSE